MWIPLCKSSELTDKPLRKVYWGTKVALFRTASGLHALEDACGHRGVPLSLGKIHGDSLRCGYHHFAFDGSGACVSTPKGAEVDEAGRRACTVHRFYTREAIGLVWISADAKAVFPIDEEKFAAGNVAAGFFPLAGHAQVWLDHYLDHLHAVFAHAPSIYGGDDDHLSDFVIDMGLPAGAGYPVEAGTLTFPPNGKSALAWGLYLSGSVRTFFRQLLAGGRARPSSIVLRATLVSPVSQRLAFRYENGFGALDFDMITFVNPIAERQNVWTAICVAHRKLPEPLAALERRNMLGHSARMHILEEDGPYLSNTEVTDVDRFHLTRADAALLTMRDMFKRYVAEKGHLYPRESMLHTMPGAAGRARAEQVVPLRVRTA